MDDDALDLLEDDNDGVDEMLLLLSDDNKESQTGMLQNGGCAFFMCAGFVTLGDVFQGLLHNELLTYENDVQHRGALRVV